jgi:hypothetical protein
LSRQALTRHLRTRLAAHCHDDSGVAAHGVAIYTLSDPRDLRAVRYVGQSAVPRRRLGQHLSAARLWLPDRKPWWVKSPRQRPLYEWIRELFQDEGRLPMMVVRAWVDASQARGAERAHIYEFLQQQLPLLNFESELLRRQLLLI